MNKNVILCLFLLCISCKRNFEIPNSDFVSNMKATLSIQQLKENYSVGDFEKILSDDVISGIVTANDRTGNFYQSIILQDSTGAIAVKIDGYNLYTSYPVGRRLYIKTKGLILGSYGGVIQLGGGVDSSTYSASLNGIAQSVVGEYIFKGSFDNEVVPVLVSPDSLTTDAYSPFMNMLVALDQVQFAQSDIGKTLADTSRTNSSVTYILQNCSGERINLRNSSYASFAAAPVPSGNGRLIAIYGMYNQEKQFMIRDTSDFQFTESRCSDQLADTNIISSIASIRQLYIGSTIAIPFGRVVRVTVISSDKNEASGNYKVQDQSGRGIAIYGYNLPTLELGKTYLIDLTGASLEMFGSELEIVNVDPTKIFNTSFLDIVPRETTVQQLTDSIFEWQSSLVKIKNLTVSSPTISTYGRTYGIMDATGSLISYVRTTAAFSIPQGAVLSLTGYVSISNGAAQLQLRTAQDIETNTAGANPNPATTSFTAEYDFSSVISSGGTVDPTPVPTVNGLVLGAFSAHGVNTSPSATGRFAFSKWPTGANSANNDFTGTLDMNAYYEMTISPEVNALMTLNSISFTLQRSATGPRQWAVRSSIDNFTENLPVSFSGSTVRVTDQNIFQIENRTSTSAVTGCNVLLENAFSGLSQAVTFRIYAFNAESNSGSFSLNKWNINGSVTK